jgi:hypothetical protein
VSSVVDIDSYYGEDLFCCYVNLSYLLNVFVCMNNNFFDANSDSESIGRESGESIDGKVINDVDTPVARKSRPTTRRQLIVAWCLFFSFFPLSLAKRCSC